MATSDPQPDAAANKPESTAAPQLEHSAYELIRRRLREQSAGLRERIARLNTARGEVFGAIPVKLLKTEQTATEHNCIARDMVSVGERFLFGFNIHFGLKSEITIPDVIAVYRFDGDAFHEENLSLLDDSRFHLEFQQLYKYYKDTQFVKFHLERPHLYMVFQTGKSTSDIKVFKWLVDGDRLRYIDNRSEHDLRQPVKHELQWKRTHRDLHRAGKHPHISIEDILFVEAVGGDLTIKVEDNTEDGQGIYREPVTEVDQTLDDAEIFYAVAENLVALRIRPFREPHFRHFIYNQRTRHVLRADAVGQACLFLPENHGLIFPNGYYTQAGEFRLFDANVEGIVFERRIASANGEDYLFVFHRPAEGEYLLASYNLIEQRMDPPVSCSGFSLFDNGRLLVFRRETMPQRNHAIQIWQTPFVSQSFIAPAKTDSILFKIGNKDIVRGIAECNEVLALASREEPWSGMYVDLTRKAQSVIDARFWLKEEAAGNIAEVLVQIRDTASAAISEFDKARQIREGTRQQFDGVAREAERLIVECGRHRSTAVVEFVAMLSQLRTVRGKLVSLKELKYIDLPAVEAVEQKVAETTTQLSGQCVEFLIRPEALRAYQVRVQSGREAIDSVTTAREGKTLDGQFMDTGKELDLLIEIVSNLRIDDATRRTAIIDGISLVYSSLNQSRALLKNRLRELNSVEGAAEFAAQLKLLGQAVSNYLDVCDTPERCDEYLTRMMVQVEELEGRFAEFDEYVVQLAEKRDEIYSAFDQRKMQIVETRNRRAASLASAASRILDGIQSRVAAFDSLDRINGYFASDLMVEKVREIVTELGKLAETVKVDEIQSRLKTIREEAVRQLRDRQELFVDGQNLIRLGNHQFTVNTQPLDLTMLLRDNQLYFHITGTNYLELVDVSGEDTSREFQEQLVVSENKQVYRGEYLAWLMFRHAMEGGEPGLETIVHATPEQSPATVQQFMGPRYNEGYIKGVHDHDAAKILKALARLHRDLGLLRHDPASRALANLAWATAASETNRTSSVTALAARLRAHGISKHLFSSPAAPEPQTATRKKARQNKQSADEVRNVETGRESDGNSGRFDSMAVAAEFESELKSLVEGFVANSGLRSFGRPEVAARFLFLELSESRRHAGEASLMFARSLVDFLKQRNELDAFAGIIDSLAVADRFRVAMDWLTAFAANTAKNLTMDLLLESASLLADGTVDSREPLSGNTSADIEGLTGDHDRARAKPYRLEYTTFVERLERFERETVPGFLRFHEWKSRMLAGRRAELRLDEFKPRVLTSFVRNRLIDEVYLPLIGNNLAKQIGAAGEEKRTDLMGLLLVISPPGYGKTTLMEYIANRLGLTFVKINGPALGHKVTSLDPEEAPNVSAREEVLRLNLALEMGDNVMIYVDDIQHTNPEFLQKFISLCDATRRMEGVFRGRPRTYDLRGRKVCVVMAGNPYTESGEKFQIPDMLANRADTYNLGDVIGGHQALFELSYLENCITSSPVLSRLAQRGQDDVRAVMSMASGAAPEAAALAGNWTAEEIGEFVTVMKKLVRVRDDILRINRQYIASAAQADAYRTEPRFQLQGSYRDMNKLAERVIAIMNDQELEALIESHYQNQAQALATGAESNLLKFLELSGRLQGDKRQRWEDIKRTFQRNLALGNINQDDAAGQIIARLALFSEGLVSIQRAVERGTASLVEAAGPRENPQQQLLLAQVGQSANELARLNQSLDQIRQVLESQAAMKQEAPPEGAGKPREIQIINRIPKAFLDVIRHQFEVLERWIDPLQKLGETVPGIAELTRSAKISRRAYQDIVAQLEKRIAADDEEQDV